MDILSVIMLSFSVCFIASIIGLVFFNFIILMSDEDKRKIAEKSKDLGLAAKVFGSKPQSKVLTNTYDAGKNHNNQELFDAGKVSPIVGLKFNTAQPNKSVTCASNETPPSHKTRVALRKKRKSKQ